MPRTGARRAAAFAPAHLTGVVLPETTARDPRGRGSRGLGVVLDRGVHAVATWNPTARRSVSVTGGQGVRLAISEEVARRLLGTRRGTLRVRLRHDLPIGQGFGTSAAGALATALAVARLVGVPRRRAVEVAHLADLFGGGGLGGVAAILDGGVEVRLRPGLPPRGQVVHRAARLPLLLGVVGPSISTSRLLGNPRAVDRLRRAAKGLLPRNGSVTLLDLATRAERFTDRLGLASRSLTAVLRALRGEGLAAAQAMFGQSFFAVARDRSALARGTDWLRRHRIPHLVVSPGATGARWGEGPRHRALRSPPVRR